MGEIKGQCPAHRGESNGSDSYVWSSTKGVGKCWSCDLRTWEYNGELYGKYGSSGKPFVISEEHEEGLGYTEDPLDKLIEEKKFNKEVTQVSEWKYEGTRGINAQTMEYYGVKKYLGVKWVAKIKGVYEEGTSDEYRFPYICGGYKLRRVDLPKEHKAHFSAVDLKSDSLFGMNKFPKGCSKKLTVVEGEFDTLAAFQMLNGGSYLNPVVSVPAGTPSHAFWEKTKEYFESYDQIILSMDNDKVGKELLNRFIEIYPEKCYVMDHGTYKDANDFLMNGEASAYKQAWWNAKRYKPDNLLLDADDYLDLYRDSPDFEYFQTGIPELDEKMLGICKGYLTLIQAETGVGKSEFMRYLEYTALKKSDYRIAAKHLEETKVRSLLGLVSYDIQENVTLKKYIEEKGLEEEVENSIKSLTKDGRFITFDIDETAGNDDLMKRLRYLIAAMEVDYIFLEPIQDAVTGANSSEKEGKLSDLASRLGNLAAETGVGIVVIAHQNSDGGAMYSSMITKKAAFKLTLKGDRDSDDVVERNRTYIYIEDKNRTGRGFGNAGRMDFDFDAYMLSPVIKEEPKVPDTNGGF